MAASSNPATKKVAEKTAQVVAEQVASNGNVVAARLPSNLLLTVTGAAVGSAIASFAVIKVAEWKSKKKNEDSE